MDYSTDKKAEKTLRRIRYAEFFVGGAVVTLGGLYLFSKLPINKAMYTKIMPIACLKCGRIEIVSQALNKNQKVLNQIVGCFDPETAKKMGEAIIEKAAEVMPK